MTAHLQAAMGYSPGLRLALLNVTFSLPLLLMKVVVKLCVLLALINIACGKPNVPDSPFPAYDHIVVVFFENHEFDSVINCPDAYYFKELISDPHTALFTHSYALTHPSQPNYIMFFSGENQGVTTTERPPTSFTTPNLAAQLVDSGYTFVTYSEGLPYPGYDGDTYGRYARKHNPVANWMGPLKNQVDSALNQPFTAFPTNYNELPTISFVVPDLDNDMHDGPISLGDAWLRTNLGAYAEWAKTNNSLLIVTFDEGNYEPDGNHIVTFFTGDHIVGGSYDEIINHYSVLRTLQDIYNLPHCGNTKTHYPIHSVFEEGER